MLTVGEIFLESYSLVLIHAVAIIMQYTR